MVSKKNILLLIILIVLDQLTKLYFKNKNFFIFNYTENTGAAFSILKNQINLLIIISIIVALIIIYYLIKSKQKRLELSLIFILSGTLGNLIDRISFKYVRDFIDLKIWPIFNLADIYNVLGFIILIIYFYKKR
ncbi:signal peptidase II [Candidatus Woesearchaeota archaeon]|nr:signal peptidase II [Candidatus Woesearchaeota archaeon]